jgi:hypothetical protein
MDVDRVIRVILAAAVLAPQCIGPAAPSWAQAASSERTGKPITFVVYGRLTYKELNGRLHHTGFAVEVSPHIAAFSGYPSDAYDYYD